MNVEIGTEAVQFPGREYINGIFVAGYGMYEKLFCLPTLSCSIFRLFEILTMFHCLIAILKCAMNVLFILLIALLTTISVCLVISRLLEKQGIDESRHRSRARPRQRRAFFCDSCSNLEIDEDFHWARTRQVLFQKRTRNARSISRTIHTPPNSPHLIISNICVVPGLFGHVC
jgi:hypothetical protein